MSLVAFLVAGEFWSQGDTEKSELSVYPAPLMNRYLKQELPQMQAGFFEGVCLPVYRALACLSPAFKRMEEAVRSNKERWKKMALEMEERGDNMDSVIVRNL
jgi:hypothetical protein